MTLQPNPFERNEIASALWEQLRKENGQWVAVRSQDVAHWEIVRPRSQEAINFACETDEHAIVERMADVLADLTGCDYERAFIVAKDALAAALRGRELGA